jgi:hypothetical protein
MPRPVTPAVKDMPTALDRVLDGAFSRLDPVAMGVATGMVSGLGLLLAAAIQLV